MTEQDLEWSDDELMEDGRPGRRKVGERRGLVIESAERKSVEKKGHRKRLSEIFQSMGKGAEHMMGREGMGKWNRGIGKERKREGKKDEGKSGDDGKQAEERSIV